MVRLAVVSRSQRLLLSIFILPIDDAIILKWKGGRWLHIRETISAVPDELGHCAQPRPCEWAGEHLSGIWWAMQPFDGVQDPDRTENCEQTGDILQRGTSPCGT